MSPDAQTLSAALQATTTAAANGTSPQAFLQDAVSHLSRLHGTAHASILLLENGSLFHGAAIGLGVVPTTDTVGLPVGPEVGTCGAAAALATPQVTPDILEDPRWAAFLGYAEESGVRSCFSVPLKLADGTVLGTFAVYHPEPYEPDQAEIDLASSYAGVVALGLDRLRSQASIAAGYEAVVMALSSALDARDEYTGQHSSETADLAATVAERLGLSPEDVAAVRQIAVLHDIGKLGIPTEILTKPGPLEADEQAVMREHPVIGERILTGIPGLEEVAKAIRHEHERWDGGGYPDGLAGDLIPLASRIVFACDAWHAMTSDRAYRPAMDHAAALAELRDHAGTQFDPRVAQALLEGLGDERVGELEMFAPRDSAEAAQGAALGMLAAELGAEDLFVFTRVSVDVYSHLGGVGRGAGWAGNIEIRPGEESLVRAALAEGRPQVVAYDTTTRIVGPYYGRSAVVVPCRADWIVLFGAPDRALAAAEPERAMELAEQARALVVDVSPAKRLADELEVLAAVRAITMVSADSVAATLAAVADRAAAALSCEYGAVMTVPTDDVDALVGWSDRGWRPGDPDAAQRALLHYAASEHALPMLCQDTAGADDAMPEGFRREDAASSIHVLPIGKPAMAMLLVVHAEPGLRGFTALCQRVASAMSDAAEVVLRRALAQERLASENAQLAEQLRTDIVTGVASRAAWEETIRSEELHRARNGRPASVVVVDLDELKLVNDSEGHAAGDDLLRRAGRALSQNIRATDFVARIGGDEFGVLLRYTDDGDAEAWCQRLLDAFSAARERGELVPSCSLGFASVPPAGTLAEAVVEADRRMYAAKAAKRRTRG
ncbi:MAG: diguanylate cyclase and metal dependent phosphohydrolase [Solirubrobacterales bacterium]|nr:diguanylate cyclase and metal dependent phosphohydrolase [Solirubrobacterales bacterium]